MLKKDKRGFWLRFGGIVCFTLNSKHCITYSTFSITLRGGQSIYSHQKGHNWRLTLQGQSHRFWVHSWNWPRDFPAWYLCEWFLLNEGIWLREEAGTRRPWYDRTWGVAVRRWSCASPTASTPWSCRSPRRSPDEVAGNEKNGELLKF